MDLQQLQQQLLELQSEIDQKARERDKILLSIESLQQTKDVAFKEYNASLKNKNETLERLERKIELFTLACYEYAEALDYLKQSLVDYGKEDIEKANQEVIAIYGKADQTKKEAEDLRVNIDKEKQDITERESQLQKEKRELELAESQLQKRQESVEIQEKELLGKKRESEQAVAKAQELLDDINRQLPEKTMQITHLDTIIERKTKEAEIITLEAVRKLKEAEGRLTVVAAREVAANERDKKLSDKESKLNDRSITINRAYRETLQRGGKIN